MVPNDILLTDTALQLLKVGIHNGVIKPLGGWQAVAFAMRTLGRLGHPEHSTIQTTRAFAGLVFLVNHLLHAFSGILRTLLHETPLKAYSNYLLANASLCLQSSHTRILLYWIQTDI